jgi:dihydrofolate reductase
MLSISSITSSIPLLVMRLSIIAAVAENGVIGRGGKLPWHLSDDLRRFKQLTMGHTIVMGRRTWESIGRPLPGRRTIVVSRQVDYRVVAENVVLAASLDDALQFAQGAGDADVFIVGGAELYRDALPRADRLCLTRVHADVPGDTYFPQFDLREWQLTASEHHEADANNDYAFRFEVYERK